MKFVTKRSYLALAAHKDLAKTQKEKHRKDRQSWETTEKELNAEITELSSVVKSLTKQREDAVAVKTKALELDEKEKLQKALGDSLTAREAAADLEDEKKYKSGYEDGVADGLRRGYDLTIDDRQNMASIAALAAASHSDGATKLIAEEIVVGMQSKAAGKARELSAGSKKKS